MKIPRSSLEPFEFEGLQIADYTAGLDVRSSIAEITVPPGVRHRRAWSKRSDKHYLVLDGRVTFEVGGEAHELGRGDCCIVPQGTRFSYRNTSEASARVLLMHTPRFDLAAEVFVED